MLYYKLPCHTIVGEIKFAVFGEQTIFCISLDAASNVFALSDHTVDGDPRLATNRRKASRNESAVSISVSSRCIALVEAQVNRQI